MIQPRAAWLLGAMILVHGAAQAEEPVDYDMVGRIRDEGFRRSSVMKTLFELSDVHGPRLAGSPAYDAAAAWARDRLAEWGLAEARLEPWGELGRGWSLERFTLEMTRPYYQPLIGYPKAWTGSTPGEIVGTPVIFNPETREAMEGFKGKLTGKLLLTDPPQTVASPFEAPARRHTPEELDQMSRATGMARPIAEDAPDRRPPPRRRGFSTEEFLKAEQPAALLSPSRGAYGALFVQGGGSTAPGSEPGLPAVVLAAEHYNRLYRLAEAEREVEVRLLLTTRFHDDDPRDYNVLADLPGTDRRLKDEIVMMGAHLDSWHGATGATDNAAGCAVVLEAARILQALGVRPRRTIRVALWGAEERGLRGSRAYVAANFGEPDAEKRPPAYERFSAYFNVDYGAGRVRGISLQGNRAARPIFEAWLRPFEDLGARTVTLEGLGSTDHVAFDRAGLPGFQFIQDPMDYFGWTHHTNMDFYDHVNEADLTQSAVILAAFVYHAAQRETRIPRKPPGARRPAATASEQDQ